MPWRQLGRVVGRGGNAKYWSLGTLGAMLERSGTAKSLRFPRKRSLTTTMQGRLCLSMSSRSPSAWTKKSWGWIQSSSVTPPSYEAGPASLRAPTGGRYSTLCGTPSPTEVKSTRKPYSESRSFRQVVLYHERSLSMRIARKIALAGPSPLAVTLQSSLKSAGQFI